jgi:N,N'-diacetylchitobiose transport system permease protein
MSSRSPAASAAVADPALSARRRRRPFVARLAGWATPYLLILPAGAVIAAVLGYPLYFMGHLSLQHYGLFQLIKHKGEWVGTKNYSQILHDALFWHVVGRTLAFTAVAVSLTMVLGTVFALLLAQLGSKMRVLLTAGLIFVWAMPVVVAVAVWSWMVDYEFGVGNWLLTYLHVGDFNHHEWFSNTWTGWAIITSLVVWGAIPFVALMVYAGLTQVPKELVEAATTDGASPWRVFRDVTMPLLKPIFVILTSLSIIWDFQVFNQIWILLSGQPPPEYFTMSIYAFTTSFQQSEYGLGSAIALVMVAILLIVSFVYIRQMVKIGDAE